MEQRTERERERRCTVCASGRLHEYRRLAGGARLLECANEHCLARYLLVHDLVTEIQPVKNSASSPPAEYLTDDF